MLDNQHLRESHGQQAFSRARKYPAKLMADKTWDVLRAVADGRTV